MPEERIPIALAQETARVGSLELWQYQHFVHHDHPFLGEDLAAIEGEPELAKKWADILRSQFPDKRFIVETSPFDRMTWYQVTSSSPTEDDAEYTDYLVPVNATVSDFNALMAQTDKSQDIMTRFKEAHQTSLKRSPRRGGIGACDHCKTENQYSDPELSDVHRGVRFMTCLSSGERLIHSTRTIRDKVGF